MRISDWSSDVCSSDLGGDRRHGPLLCLPVPRFTCLGLAAIRAGIVERLFKGDDVGRIRSTDYDDIRDTIIDRAASAFARRGFAATSISDIADACACSRSRLYHYFDSKEALLRELLATHVDALLQPCQDVASGDRKGVVWGKGVSGRVDLE